MCMLLPFESSFAPGRVKLFLAEADRKSVLHQFVIFDNSSACSSHYFWRSKFDGIVVRRRVRWSTFSLCRVYSRSLSLLFWPMIMPP